MVPAGSGREKGRAEGPAAPRGSADKAPAAAFVPFSDGVCSNYPRPGRHMGGGGAHGAGAAALAGLPAPASRAPAPTTLSPSLTLGGLPIECPRPLSFTFGENGIRSLPVYWPKVKPKPKPPGIHPRPDLERFPGKGVKGAPQISGDGGPRTGPRGGSLVLHKAGCQGCRRPGAPTRGPQPKPSGDGMFRGTGRKVSRGGERQARPAVEGGGRTAHLCLFLGTEPPELSPVSQKDPVSPDASELGVLEPPKASLKDGSSRPRRPGIFVCSSAFSEPLNSVSRPS